MKNKKLTYILLPLVGVIWGFFFYTLFSNKSTVQSAPVDPITDSIEIADSISFKSLDLDYSDPFLKRKIVAVGQKILGENKSFIPSSKQISGQFNKPKVTATTIWPRVEYGGTINQNKGLIRINNDLVLLKKGETQGDVKLISLYQDSIRLQYKKELKTFLKNQ